MSEITSGNAKGVIFAKKGDNTAFALGKGDWYNIDRNSPEAKSALEKIEKGVEVSIDFNKSGTARYVTKIVAIEKETVKEEVKYEQKTKEEANKPSEIKKMKSFYGSEEDIRGKRRGCALGAAAQILSNPNIEIGDGKPLTVEALAQATTYLAGKLEDWLSI